MAKKTAIIPAEAIERRIYLIRREKVMLDRDLAALYQVKPIALRQQVKRNQERFPDDFVFRLSQHEAETLVSQNVIPSHRSFGGHLPYVFTEQGVAMLSTVLKSKRAVRVSVAIMRAFVRLRQILSTHKDLAARMEKLEAAQEQHGSILAVLIDEIEELKVPPPRKPKRPIGFVSSKNVTPH
jgi:ORF6N domain-containing protein